MVLFGVNWCYHELYKIEQLHDPGSLWQHQFGLWIRLIKKLALMLNGIDLSHRQVGEVFLLPVHDAALLIGEGWAEQVDRRVSAGRRKTDYPEAATG